ncbi:MULTISPECIES: hypothetical protein [unclassified Streptomyces]|uniref:hypothetical protein n=1 Tax=unclassified Streptomyces TaxID=2593676 RepID=UPI001FFC4171|nr:MULTISPECIES: hypothetical protein [unclassified Streptomyces]
MAVFGGVGVSLCERSVQETGLGAVNRWLGGSGCFGSDADLGQEPVLFGVECAVFGALTLQPVGQLLLKAGNAGPTAVGGVPGL